MLKDQNYIRLKIDANGIASPSMKASQLANDVVATGLIALDEHDFSTSPKIDGAKVSLAFRSSAHATADWKEECKSFLVRKGFQELAKGLKESLDQAYLAIFASRLAPEQIPTEELWASVLQLLEKANSANFPTVLGWLNSEFGEELNNTAMIMSFQKARSCLEHRDGLVAKRDINNEADGCLEVSFYEMQIIATGIESGKSEEVQLGKELGEASTIAVTRNKTNKRFALGERIKFSPQDFSSLAFSCTLFAGELAERTHALLIADGLEES